MSALAAHAPGRWKSRDRRRADRVFDALHAGGIPREISLDEALAHERDLLMDRVTPAQARGYLMVVLNALRELGCGVPELAAITSLKPASPELRSDDHALALELNQLLATLWAQLDEQARAHEPVDPRLAALTLLGLAVVTGSATVGQALPKKVAKCAQGGRQHVQASSSWHWPHATFGDWLRRPLAHLDPWAPEAESCAHVIPLGAGVSLAVAAFRRTYSGVNCLGDILEGGELQVLQELAAHMSTPARAWTGKRLARAQQAFERLHIPAAFRREASPRFAWAPLFRRALHRIVLGTQEAFLPEADSEEPGTTAVPVTFKIAPASAAESYKRLKRLVSRLRPDRDGRSLTKPRALAHVEQTLNNAGCGLSYHLLAWAHARLRRETVKPQSLARYLSSLLPLLELQGYQTLIVQNAAGRHGIDDELWEEMLAEFSALSKDKDGPARLLEFHRYLARHFPVLEHIDTSDIDGLTPDPVPRASLVTERELETACALVKISPEHARAVTLATALAFYAGLRRGELRRLRLDDVLDPHTLHIRVRARQGESHKTANAARDLELEGLLPGYLHDMLRQHMARLVAAGRPGNTHLLGNGEHPLPQYAFNLVSQALKEVTGDAKASVHALRHSFITWNACRIALGAHPYLAGLPVMHRLGDFLAEDRATPAVSAILGRDDVPPHALHLLAKRVGHASPRTTLVWYSHLHVYLRAGLLEHERPEPSVGLLERWSGLPQAAFTAMRGAARRRLDRLGCASVPRAACVLNGLLHAQFQPSPLPDIQAAQAAAPTRIVDVPALIPLLKAAEGDIVQAGERFGIADTPCHRRLAEWSMLAGRFQRIHLNDAKVRFIEAATAIEQLDPLLKQPGLLAWSTTIMARTTRAATDDWRTFRLMLRVASAVMKPGHVALIELLPFDCEPGSYQRAEQILAQWIRHHLPTLIFRIVPSEHWARPPKASARQQRSTLERHWICLRIAHRAKISRKKTRWAYICDEAAMLALACAAALEHRPTGYNGQARDRLLRKAAKAQGIAPEDRPPVLWRAHGELPDPDVAPGDGQFPTQALAAGARPSGPFTIEHHPDLPF